MHFVFIEDCINRLKKYKSLQYVKISLNIFISVQFNIKKIVIM